MKSVSTEYSEDDFVSLMNNNTCESDDDENSEKKSQIVEKLKKKLPTNVNENEIQLPSQECMESDDHNYDTCSCHVMLFKCYSKFDGVGLVNNCCL